MEEGGFPLFGSTESGDQDGKNPENDTPEYRGEKPRPNGRVGNPPATGKDWPHTFTRQRFRENVADFSKNAWHALNWPYHT